MGKNEELKRTLQCISAALIYFALRTTIPNTDALQNDFKSEDNKLSYATEYYSHDLSEMTVDQIITYYKLCADFKKEYILENYHEGMFGPFNCLGIEGSTYTGKLHNIFDENKEYLGTDLISLNMLNEMYQTGQYELITHRQTYTERFNTMDYLPEDYKYFTNVADKTLIFNLSNGKKVLIFAEYKPNGMSVKIQLKNDSICEAVRSLYFKATENGLILADDRIVREIKSSSGDIISTTDTYTITNKGDYINNIDIYLKINGKEYIIKDDNLFDIHYSEVDGSTNNDEFSKDQLDEVKSSLNNEDIKKAISQIQKLMSRKIVKSTPKEEKSSSPKTFRIEPNTEAFKK